MRPAQLQDEENVVNADMTANVREWVVAARKAAPAAAALAAAALAVSTAGAHEPGRPDFTGMWLGAQDIFDAQPVNGRESTGWPEDPPLTDAGREAMESYDPRVDDPPEDCLPWGYPRNVTFTFYPLQIVQLQDKMLMIYEYDPIPRRIYLDDREVPDDIPPLWFGYSVGHWEEETLVIETSHIRGDNILTTAGLPQSPEMTVTERLTLLDDGETLESQVRIHDPLYYTEPFDLTVYWGRTDREQHEFVCVEGLSDNITELDKD